ncbi:MAG: hypothetical protein WBM44_27515 [Waterburya sp.]
MTQFYKLTLDRAIADYRDGLITATGLLRYYLKIRYAPGWKIRINPEEICSLLGFTKATFYKALGKLKKLGRAEIGKLNLIPLTLTEEEETDEKQDSPTVDPQSPTVYSESPTVESNSPTGKSSLQLENLTPPNPPKIKADSDSPDSSSNSYQLFSSSLSDSQRESFLGFCQQQAKELPKPPVLVKKWIQSNWEELRGLWCKKSPNVAYLSDNISQQDWYNHPRFNRWKRRLECEYEAPYFITLLKNGGTEEERRAFARWAIDNGVVKVPEGVTIDGL